MSEPTAFERYIAENPDAKFRLVWESEGGPSVAWEGISPGTVERFKEWVDGLIEFQNSPEAAELDAWVREALPLLTNSSTGD